MNEQTQTIGHVKQVLGPVVDVEFPEGKIPAIYNALRLTALIIPDSNWEINPK